MNHTLRIDEDGHGWAPSHDSGADADAGWDAYRNSPQYAIDKEKWAVLEMMAEALSMPRSESVGKNDPRCDDCSELLIGGGFWWSKPTGAAKICGKCYSVRFNCYAEKAENATR